LIKEGCIEETIGAIEVRLRANYAEDPAIKAALTQVASDEMNHAQFAWDTLEWIMDKFPDIRGFVTETFRVELERNMQRLECKANTKELPSICTKPCTDSEETKVFRRYGLLGDDDRDEVRKAAILDVIEPTYRTGFKDVKMISKGISKLNVVAG
jgi:hypothetical protein